MIINWHPNPLKTIVELDHEDRKILLLKLHIDYLEDQIGSAAVHLEEGKFFNLDQARKDLNIEFDKEKLFVMLNEKLKECEAYLKENHAGDCTCFPVSCMKCYAEDLLGINTIKGLKSHSANMIYNEFSKPDKQLNDVIAYLDKYNPVPEGVWLTMLKSWNQNIVRWRQDAKAAADWLKNYKTEKL